MKAEMEAIRRDMEGIIALLLSLAAIADRACRAPFAARARVLSLLWPAEQVARGYVFSSGNSPAAPACGHADASVADAENLAARFRCLAIILAGVVARLSDGRRSCDPVRSRGSGDAAGVMSGFGSACRSLPPFDTS